MSTTETRGMCQEVEESLAAILDGTASAELFEHVADCDACRDLKHEAAVAAARVRDAGADFRTTGDFVERLLGQLDAARSGPRDAAASGPKLPDEPESIGAAPTIADAKPDVAEAEMGKPSATLPSAPVGAGATRAEAPVSIAVVPAPAAPASPAGSEPVALTVAASPVSAAAAITQPSAAEPAEPNAAVAEARPAAAAPVPAAPKPKGGELLFLRRPVFYLAAAAMAAAAAVGLFLLGKGALPVSSSAPWSGSVASVSRASADKSGGLDACDASGRCSPVASGAPVAAGATLRTDARTRARVTFADGTELALDRASEIQLSRRQSRSARLKRGTVVADVAHVDGTTARFELPRGEVEVLGTKLALTAGDDRASIEVARGSVRVRNGAGRTVDVRAGEEATLVGNAEPVVASSSSLADTMAWSDARPEESDAPALRGLGELRARKPGQTQEKDHAVRLAKHAVKVRIVDVVARTEVDETFANDTDEELEGIYRFPLPPGAQIEKLSLEVDGRLVDGAFVDRDKGAAIWRGVIHNAAPKTPKPREEIIWVPGPWRDPALLEWQRGGRFELRIFPIPRRGSRRVVLTYTQTVDQAAGIRRFTYPLAHDPSGSTKIGSFDLDVQVLGLDESVAVQTRGYDMQLTSGDGERRTLHAEGFVPAGDLTVEYALPDRAKEVTAWAYAAPSFEEGAPLDRSPYVAIAVRPRLPRWQEAKERLHVLVVDSSRSMFGERFARASRLASSIVREMDRRDSFMLLACDTLCRPMTAEQAAPGAAAASAVERFLGGIEPDGGSDLAATVAAARLAALPAAGGKELRILYLGDGTPSVGPTRPAHLEAAVHAAIPDGVASVIAVALGADADTTSLAALARGGGGVVVPYVPGQKLASAALDVLSAAYGVVLRDVSVELPAGLTDITPSRIDPIRAGGETILVARLSSGNELSGAFELKGRVAGEPFAQSFPLRVLATSGAGNAFVPRLYAAAKIAEIERSGGDAQRPLAIELSKRFSVASRYTSLLVLESEAMFKAFGLDRTTTAPVFTGEQRAESSTSESDGQREEIDADADEKKELDREGRPNAYKDDLGAGFGSGHGRLGGPEKKGKAGPDFATPPAKPSSQARKRTMSSVPGDPLAWDMPPPPPRRYVPMRRVYERHVSFAASNGFASNASRLAAAESAAVASPDSRDKTVELFSLYSTLGRIGDAQDLTAKWAGRDAFDPDAILARADLAARQGDRERAVRILGGLADVRPGDRAVQARLADLQEAAGNAALACAHRVALADLAAGDPKALAAAVACAGTQGLSDLASALRFDAADKVREALDKPASAPVKPSSFRGDLQLSAEWSGGADLDIALIDARGKRTSWLGSASKANVAGRDVKSTRGEALEISGLPQGNYVVEVTRADGGREPVRGDVTVKFGGQVTKLPFALSGVRAEVGTLRVYFTSKLVPL